MTINNKTYCTVDINLNHSKYISLDVEQYSSKQKTLGYNYHLITKNMFMNLLLQTSWHTSYYTRSILLLKISFSLITHIMLLLCFPDPLSLRANGGSHIPCGPACSPLPSTSGVNVGNIYSLSSVTHCVCGAQCSCNWDGG